MKRQEAEPEHYSWNLGTPDNAVATEVIVNPYGNSQPQNHPAYQGIQDRLSREAESRQLDKDYPKDINPYHGSFSVSFDDSQDQILLPTVDAEGRDLDEDEAIMRYREDGRNLGIFRDRESADAYVQQKAPSITMPPLDIGNLTAEDMKRFK